MRAGAHTPAYSAVVGGVMGIAFWLQAPAHAAPPPSFIASDKAASDRADELVKQGLALGKLGRWAEAEGLLREAWSLKRAYDIAGNLGIVEAALGKSREAAEHLTYAFKTFPTSGKPEQKKLLEQTLAKVLPLVVGVTIKANVEGAEVLVDGVRVGTTPLGEVVFVEPGPRRIEARRVGYGTVSQSVQVEKGVGREVGLVLVEAPKAPVVGTEGSPVPTGTGKRSVVPGAVLGGIAGAALVTGIGLFAAGRAKASSAHDVSDAVLKAGHSCVRGAANEDPRCADLLSTASTSNAFQGAGVGLFIGAAAAAVGTVIYFVLPPSSSRKSSGGTLRVTPVAGPAATGLTLSGTF